MVWKGRASNHKTMKYKVVSEEGLVLNGKTHAKGEVVELSAEQAEEFAAKVEAA